MRMVSTAVVLSSILASGGCAREGNARNVEAGVSEWNLPGPKTERKVFGPMLFEEVKDFTQAREQEGWRVVAYEPVGQADPGRYLIVMERWVK